MKYQTVLVSLTLLSAAAARPVKQLHRREVPQEHSHEKFLRTTDTFLKKNNPDGIVDSVFGLLGNAAAQEGQGQISDTDCLQQATADRAFTNAKKAGSVKGMTAALIYRALERNTGAVGEASVLCTSIKAVNPEIAALSQHQDPASKGAAKINKDITLELAKQIKSVGGNPVLALKSGTFAPGQIGDPTAAGNTCDDANDPVGCIFTLGLLVEDASAAEVKKAASGNVAASSTSGSSASGCDTSAATASSSAAASTSSSSSSSNAAIKLGTCSNPTIKFGIGFDGRTEASFEPADLSQFGHGSAQNIAIITDFICQQLGNGQCQGTNQAAIDACNQGAAAAATKTGQAAADAFNAALGF